MACPICSNADAVTENHVTRDANVIDCPQCGNYVISRSAIALLGNYTTDKWKISAWINEFKPEIITSATLDTAHSSTSPSLHHRAERMLRLIAATFPPGKQFTLEELGKWKDYEQVAGEIYFLSGGKLVSSRLMPVGWNKSINEMLFMVTEVLCNEMKLLDSQNNTEYQVSPKGLLYLEGRRESISSVGFCAMWFSDEVLPLWTEVIAPAITAAGYEALRIDSKQHNGKIDDEIMASIRASKFVVSDFTGSRGGVYYEAGFAHGLGLPVIFMCRENDLKDIHFDVRQYNCILWTPEKLEEAQSQLKNRILATLGQGPKLVQ
jgi:nucleoside 2-deoxyribosyltransferase/predicted RNA-binding Zn-ribbon protein involved in translation (DUF1610 family)